jgi:XTP/dITP diphosphohydrolase
VENYNIMLNTALIIASGNAHKVKEFQKLLEGIPFDIHSAQLAGGMPTVVENGDSFAANAQIKAEALHQNAPAGAWVLADDSGLEVNALAAAPGIYSARYAGETASDSENVTKLLNELEGLPLNKRAARFRCVLCLIDDQGNISHYAGECQGHIAIAPQGSAGFGYDPVFVPTGNKESFAQLADTIKQQISHRAQATEFLKQVLKEF